MPEATRSKQPWRCVSEHFWQKQEVTNVTTNSKHAENMDRTQSPSVHSSVRCVWHFYTFNIQPLMAKKFSHPQLFHNKGNIFSTKKRKSNVALLWKLWISALCFASLIAQIGFWSYVLSLSVLIKTFWYFCTWSPFSSLPDNTLALSFLPKWDFHETQTAPFPAEFLLCRM